MPKPRSGVRIVPMPKPATDEVAPARNAMTPTTMANVIR